MLDFLQKHQEKFFATSIALVFLIALFNPVFKKYDYGAGYPLVLLLGILIPFLLYAGFRQKREKNLTEQLLLGLFVLLSILSFSFSETRNVGFSEVLVFAEMAFLYLILANTKFKWKDHFFQFWAIFVLGAVGIGFVFYFFQPEPRIFGPFFNILYHANKWPNAFALFLLMSWPILMIIFRKWNLFGAISLSVCFSALLLTYSRGAFIALCGQAVLLLIYFWPRINRKVFAWALATIVLSGAIFWSANYVRSTTHEVLNVGEKIQFANGELQTSKGERLDFWRGAVELAKDKPLLGYGPFSFRYAYNPIQKTLLGNSDHPHNLFLKIAAEEGLIAMAVLILLLATIAFTVMKRFAGLSGVRKDEVFLLSTAALGALAHNLIDYNFNFLVNILAFFLLLIFIKANVVKKANKVQKGWLAIIVGILIAIFSIYEGVVYTLAYIADGDYLRYSLFPRNYYLQATQEEIADGNVADALYFVSRQLELNPLDAQASYLKGVIYCSSANPNLDLQLCQENYEDAIEKNPLNDFVYYRDYLRVAALDGIDAEEREVVNRTANLLASYFSYVSNNVHFTAYTTNVEAAAETIKIILPYLPQEWADSFELQGEQMLQKAETLRSNKAF